MKIVKDLFLVEIVSESQKPRKTTARHEIEISNIINLTISRCYIIYVSFVKPIAIARDIIRSLVKPFTKFCRIETPLT